MKLWPYKHWFWTMPVYSASIGIAEYLHASTWTAWMIGSCTAASVTGALAQLRR